MTSPWRLMILAASFFAGGCAVQSELSAPSQMCNFTRYNLEVEIPDSVGSSTPAPHDGTSLGDVYREAITATSQDTAGEPPNLLFLSGGSLNGAFGAGFLDEWKRRAGKLPDFKVVTGISTGAILATFAFIDEPAPLTGPQGYGIRRENDLLHPLVDTRRSPTEGRNLLRVLHRGSIADLEPLKGLLLRNLTPEVLAKVGEAQGKRKLLVGVVDVDTGKAVALDLTDMAARYTSEGNPDRKALLRECYAKAIIASSSSPLAAPPVFIDNRMYADGGLRFGTFSDELGQALESLSNADVVESERVRVIVNGDLRMAEQCGKTDANLCKPPQPPSGGFYGGHRDWNLLALAFRSEQMLVNQNQRMSVKLIQQDSKIEGRDFKHVIILDDVNRHFFTMDDPELGTGTMSCADWYALDRDLDHPVQFYPRYMHCLIDYGRARAREALDGGW